MTRFAVVVGVLSALGCSHATPRRVASSPDEYHFIVRCRPALDACLAEARDLCPGGFTREDGAAPEWRSSVNRDDREYELAFYCHGKADW